MSALYSERIARRRRVWWQAPRPGGERPVSDALHRLAERRSVRRRDDPDPAWHCCANWQRTLLDKRNAREFAARHGCELPGLLWRGRSLRQAPLDRFPDAFVVRPARGLGTRGVLVVDHGRNLLDGQPVDRRTLLRRVGLLARLRSSPETLVEEMIRPREPERTFPLEIKLHAFGGEVGIVQVNDRPTVSTYGLDVATSFYTPEWEQYPEEIDPVHGGDAVHERPPDLDRMLELGTLMGAAIGTYMRVDFFDSDRGPVFNEFASTPWLAAKGSAFADRLLGDLWARHCPEGV